MKADNQTTIAAPAPTGCPHARAQAVASSVHPDLALRRASEVAASEAPETAFGETIAWVRRFLAKPNPDLGRAGPVCPFTPMALELDTIWMTEVRESTPDPSVIQNVIEQCREIFMQTEPRDGPLAINKVIMVVFSGMSEADAPWIDAMQARLKPGFVEVGLMLGEFHARNETPGLRNEAFRPLRSPIPMLVIRHMVESDLPFLKRMVDRPDIRASYLRSYLRRLGATIRRNYFDQAVEALVDAELEVRAAVARPEPAEVAR